MKEQKLSEEKHVSGLKIAALSSEFLFAVVFAGIAYAFWKESEEHRVAFERFWHKDDKAKESDLTAMSEIILATYAVLSLGVLVKFCRRFYSVVRAV